MTPMSLTRLNQFGFLAITGPDAIKFLQGYATCDLTRLPDTPMMGAICNLQGRMLTSFRIAQTDHGVILRMDKPLVPRTLEFLSKYIVFSKAEMQDISDSTTCYGCMGTADDLPEAGITVPVGTDRFEYWSTESLDADEDARWWVEADIRDGLAWVSSANSEEYLPQMLNYHLHEAIDFAKGCYLGQEIVARMQYRGELKRRLHRAEAAASLSDELTLNDKTIGQVVASAGSQSLAVLQNSDPAIEVTLNGEPVTFSLVE